MEPVILGSTLITILSLVCGCLITLVTLAGAGFLVYKAFGGTFKNMAGNSSILRTGVSAPAVILNVQDTGVTMNDNPQARIRLRVMPVGGEPFEAETTAFVGRFQVGMFVPGASLMVKYDPNDKTRVAIESLSYPGMNAAGQ
ncbi:MAG: hypothetical protein DPW18_19365 [Chloroflexi bacterium]|nr:hypothetical protein [Chloroflexota bacterium]MDL1944871.1 hypothetical protein [Chloroflexi bacterium CFX2]